MMTIQVEFRNGMAKLGSAVSVVTTDGLAGKYGFTASAVCSVTDKPPTLLVCMNRNSFANSYFKKNGVLCVNVLSNNNRDLAEIFSNSTLYSEQRFLHGKWQLLVSGAPVLCSAVANFDCAINEFHEIGSHTVFYCQVQSVRVSECPNGLMYFNRRYYDLCSE